MFPKRVVGLVVARNGSSRVPRKALLDLCGQPALRRIIDRAKQIQGIDVLCLATSTLAEDEVLVDIAKDAGISFYQGDPEKVLDRLYYAAVRLNAEVIVELGGDCPLLDPKLIDNALSFFFSNSCDYLSNYDPPTFPEGLEVNIIKMEALEKAFQKAKAPSQRIHAFSYLTCHPEDFRLLNYAQDDDYSHFHWSLDFQEDIPFVKLLYSRFKNQEFQFDQKDILELLGKDQEMRLLHAPLIRPKVLHSYWNSPGIIRDMNSDILSLCDAGRRAALMENFDLAHENYSELIRIAKELERYALHRAASGQPENGVTEKRIQQCSQDEIIST